MKASFTRDAYYQSGLLTFATACFAAVDAMHEVMGSGLYIHAMAHILGRMLCIL